MGYNPVDTNLALALALEGASTGDADIRRLVGVARLLEAVPDPDIDPGFAARLEARLMTEDVRLVHLVPPTPRPDEPTDLPEVEHRAAIIRLPRRRFVVRKSLAATIAAALALALPVVAAGSALPGSPTWGLKIRLERARIALERDFVAKGWQWFGFSANRLADMRQFKFWPNQKALPSVLALLEEGQKNATSLILAVTKDSNVLAQVAGALQRQSSTLMELAYDLPLSARDDVLDAIRIGQALSLRVAAALGLPMIRPPATASPGAGASSDDVLAPVPSEADWNGVDSGSTAGQPAGPSDTPEAPDTCNARAPKLTCGDIHTDSTFVVPVAIKGPKDAFNRSGPVDGCPDATTCALYKLQGYRWPTNAEGVAGISFSINPKDSRMSETDATEAILAATQTWSRANPNIRFSLKGFTTRTPLSGARAKDGYNDIYWSPLDLGILAMASVRASHGRILEADITFNSLLPWGWSPCTNEGQSCTPVDPGSYDAQAIATHELGHLLGLGHFDRGPMELKRTDPTQELSMNAHPSSGERKQATLGLGDVLGIRAAYPCQDRSLPPVYAP